MIEAHPVFSEAPHLRSSPPHPENRLQQNLKCIPMSNLMAHVYKNVIFQNKIGTPPILGLGTPSFIIKYFGGNVLPLS